MVIRGHQWSPDPISGHETRFRRVSYAGSPSVVRGLAECRTSARRVSYAGAPSVVRRVAECRTAGRRRTQNDPKRPKTTPKPPQNHPSVAPARIRTAVGGCLLFPHSDFSIPRRKNSKSSVMTTTLQELSAPFLRHKCAPYTHSFYDSQSRRVGINYSFAPLLARIRQRKPAELTSR